MSDIDWCKAPEGTTHWVNSKIACWHKHVNGTCLYWSHEQKWVDLCQSEEVTINDYGKDGVIKRPETSAWTGTGLPPVGIDCEYMKRGGAEWFYCTVIAHHDGGAVVAVHEDDLSYSYWKDSGHFRPIRTPEQIAAEEREKSAKELYDDIDKASRPDRLSTCRALYDLGWRKTEAP